MEQLSAYQLWQLLKFGNYLPDQEPEEPWDDEIVILQYYE